MTEIGVFSSPNSIREWGERLSRQSRAYITNRAALRVFPLFHSQEAAGLDDNDLNLIRSAAFVACNVHHEESSVSWSKMRNSCQERFNLISSFLGRQQLATQEAMLFSLNCINTTLNNLAQAELFAHSLYASLTSLSTALENPILGSPLARLAASDAVAQEIRADRPLWHTENPPSQISHAHKRLIARLREDTAWAFWLRFYEGMWNGTFDDWDLALEVIQIPEEDWEKGYVHIGEVIAGIEARMRPDPLPESEARAQAVQLLAQPNPAALAADGLAQLIEMATIEYKREISNALPEEIGPLENLPDLLRNISLILTSSKPETEREERLQEALRLAAGMVSDLNGRLKRSATELESCRRDGNGRRLFADAFYEKAGGRVAELVTSKILWGGLVSGAGFILGGGSADALTVGLQECFQNVITPEAEEAVAAPLKPKN